MKNFIALVFLLLVGTSSIYTQSFNFQGALRHLNGQLMVDDQVDLRISIYEDGSKVFEEEHLGVATNDVGILNARIGSINNKAFKQIHFDRELELMLELKKGQIYEVVSRAPIAAVPLAMHAYSAENTDDADADSTNELQSISFDASNNILTLSHGGEVDLSALDNDEGESGPGTDDQNLSLSGTMLSIEDGNAVDLKGLKDADADPINEIQKLSLHKPSKKLSLSNGGGTVDLGSIIHHQADGYWDKQADIVYTSYEVLLDNLFINKQIRFPKSILTPHGWESQRDFGLRVSKDKILRINGEDKDGLTKIGYHSDVHLSTGRGLVGIGTQAPKTKLEVISSSRVNLGTGGILSVGGDSGPNMAFDGSTIQSKERQNGYTLHLNPLGGGVEIGQSLDVGSQAGGSLIVGSDHQHLAIGSKVIQARANGRPAELRLNPHGGTLRAPSLGNIGDKANMQYNTSTGEIGYDNSSRRYKTNIVDLNDDWYKILQARPVRYDRPNSPGEWEYGYIAEEMDSIGLGNLVFYDQEGLPENFNYEKMILYLTELLKDHDKKIQLRDDKIFQLEAKLERQDHSIISLHKRILILENPTLIPTMD